MYAICRVNKVKGAGKVKAMGAHNTRTRSTPNADNSGNFTVIKGTNDVSADVYNNYKAHNCNLRKNGVDAVEVLLTASPEYFRSNKGDYGEFDYYKTRDFAAKSMEWVESYFGQNNVVNAVIHLDEATPHLHVVVTPIAQNKNNKNIQSAKRWLGPKTALSEMQDSYANAVAELGLKRGNKNSKAKHKDIKQYYENVNKDGAKLEDLNKENVELKQRVGELEVENEDLRGKLGEAIEIIDTLTEDESEMDYNKYTESELYRERRQIEREFDEADEGELNTTYFKNLAKDYEKIENAIENKLETDVDIDAWCSSREKEDNGPEL